MVFIQHRSSASRAKAPQNFDCSKKFGQGLSISCELLHVVYAIM